MKYHVIGPSPLEKGVWLVYLPYANSLVEIDEDTGERLWECEHFNKCEGIGHILKELDAVKPNSIRSIPQSPNPTNLYIMVSGICNLSCAYCFANQGNYGVKKYSKLIEEKVIKRIPEVLSAFSAIRSIAFFGGEPLLAYKYIEKIIKEIEKIGNFELNIITNGTILNSNIIELLKTYHFRVTVSIDGWKIVHDLNRKTLKGNGSFDIIIKNLNIIKSNKLPLKIEATYHLDLYKYGVTPYKVALYLSKLNQLLYVKPATVFETNKNRYQPSHHSFLTSLYLYGEYLVNSLWELTKTNASFLEETILHILSMLTNRTSRAFRCNFYKYLTLFPNGDLYTCHILATKQETPGYLGNIALDNAETLWRNYITTVEKMKNNIVASKPYHQLFDDCPASDPLYSRFEDHYQYIFDNLLVTYYIINQTGQLVQVLNNIKRLHPVPSAIQIQITS
jgi:uncharacterized protein